MNFFAGTVIELKRGNYDYDFYKRIIWLQYVPDVDEKRHFVGLFGTRHTS